MPRIPHQRRWGVVWVCGLRLCFERLLPGLVLASDCVDDDAVSQRSASQHEDNQSHAEDTSSASGPSSGLAKSDKHRRSSVASDRSAGTGRKGDEYVDSYTQEQKDATSQSEHMPDVLKDSLLQLSSPHQTCSDRVIAAQDAMTHPILPACIEDPGASSSNAALSRSRSSSSSSTSSRPDQDELQWSSASYALSNASTQVFEQEPFGEWAAKVAQLVIDVILDGSEDTALYPTITHMDGGSHHRVVKVGFRQRDPLVVRTPRYWYDEEYKDGQRQETDNEILALSRMEKEIATLSLLEDADLNLPIPSVVCYDMTPRNALGRPYMIQKLLPGEFFQVAYPHLSLKEKLEITRDIARCLGKIHNIHLPFIGPIVPRTAARPHGIGFFYWEMSQTQRRFGSPRYPLASDLKSYLASRFEFQQSYEEAQDWAPYMTVYAQRFSVLAERLLAERPPSDKPITIWHADFFPRNMLVQKNSATNQYEISGVIDWEGTAAVPVEMAYRLPSFLWDWTKQWSSLHDAEADEPDDISSAEAVEIRRVFHEEIEQYIPGFWELATSCREIRMLAWFLTWGIHSQDEINAAEYILMKHGL